MGAAFWAVRKEANGEVSGHWGVWSLVGLLSGTLLLMQVITYYAVWTNPVFNLLSLLFYVLLIGLPPLVYVYLRQVLGQDTDDAWSFPHFLPSGVLLVVNVFGFLVITFGKPESIFHTYVEEIVFFVNFTIITFFFILQNVFYVYLCHQLLARTKGDDVPPDAHIWSRLHILGYLGFIAAAYFQQISFRGYTGWTLSGIFGLYCLFLIRQHHRQPHAAVAYIKALTQPTDRKKTDDEPLIDEDMVGKLQEKLMHVIREDKIYLQPDLSLSALSKAVDTNDKYLRYVLSRMHASGFVSFVNHYRVEDAKVLLTDDEYNIYTVESIGQMAGFKSKSSFYAAFKEETGMTPFQYRQEQAAGGD